MANEAPHVVEPEHSSSIGLGGWLVLLSQAIGITFVIVLKASWAVIRGIPNGHSFYKFLAFEATCNYQSRLSVKYIQNLLPSTTWVCRWFARRNGLPVAVMHLGAGTTVVRLGPEKPAKAIAFFHGGGYMAPALTEHIHFACGFRKTLPAGLSVYVLQYALVSETANQYPRQLQQAVSLFEYLFDSEKLAPSAITLVGDSAGGHLAISLLLHLAHPNPRVRPLPMNGRRLGGAALISPWIIHPNSEAHNYVQTNEGKDVLYGAALDSWARNFLQNGSPKETADPWGCPLTAPADWWCDLPVDDIFVAYGEDEIMRDDMADFCALLRLGHVRTTAAGYSGEAHVHMIMNRFLMIREPCVSEDQYLQWLDVQLRS